MQCIGYAYFYPEGNYHLSFAANDVKNFYDIIDAERHVEKHFRILKPNYLASILLTQFNSNLHMDK